MRSHYSLVTPEAFWPRVDKSGECWMWGGSITATGYGQLKVRRQVLMAHRIAYLLANGELPDDLFVCHTCDNPPCVRPEHLFLGTRGDNNRDRHAKGRDAHGATHGSKLHPERLARGERNGFARLTRADVDTIRTAYAIGDTTQRALARRFGVSAGTIGFIVRGETWRD